MRVIQLECEIINALSYVPNDKCTIIKLSDLSKVLQDTFWPDGVHVRRFYKKHQQQLQDPPPVEPPVESVVSTHKDQMDDLSSQSLAGEQTRLKEVIESHDG